MFKHPHINGPAELLGFARAQSENDSDAARTAAFMATDQAVEIMLRNEVELPWRNEGPWEFREVLNKFRRELPNALNQIDPAVIEECHQRRNKLQHEYRFAVRQSDLKVYLEVANQLFENLYQAKLPSPQEDTLETARAHFRQTWLKIESELRALRDGDERRFGPRVAMFEADHVIQRWADNSRISSLAARCFPLVRDFRNRLDEDPTQPPSRRDVYRYDLLAEIVLEELQDRDNGP